MDYEFIKTRIAPCGLHCGKCFAFVDGDINSCSIKLKNMLGNFQNYANRFVYLMNEPLFNKYNDFSDMLLYFSSSNCAGCRVEKCRLFKDCKVKDCCNQNNIDYCFQCSSFPCNKTGFDEHLYNRFIDINTIIKEVGIEKYYDKIKDKPRY